MHDATQTFSPNCRTGPPLSTSGACQSRPGPFRRRLRRFQFTEQSRFGIELLVKDALRVGANRPPLILHDAKDQEVEGANVSAAARDPGGTRPDRHLSVTAAGSGRYRLEEWEVDRPREVLLEIRSCTRSAEDRVRLRIPAVLQCSAE